LLTGKAAKQRTGDRGNWKQDAALPAPRIMPMLWVPSFSLPYLYLYREIRELPASNLNTTKTTYKNQLTLIFVKMSICHDAW